MRPVVEKQGQPYGPRCGLAGLIQRPEQRHPLRHGVADRIPGVVESAWVAQITTDSNGPMPNSACNAWQPG